MLWFGKEWIFWSLAASMLGMGLTLSLEDFKAIARMPGSVALGFGAQYTIMPLCGWLVATLMRLEPGLAVGIILVASCPGGMASNMISYLAKANVALSVVLTMCSTLLAFFFTPMWTSLLAGNRVEVDVVEMSLSALKLTIAPVTLGVLIRWLLPKTADRIGACGPTVAVIAFTLVTGGIVAASADAIAANFGRPRPRRLPVARVRVRPRVSRDEAVPLRRNHREDREHRGGHAEWRHGRGPR